MPHFSACWALSLCKTHLYEPSIETGSAGATLSLRTCDDGQLLNTTKSKSTKKVASLGPRSQSMFCELVGPRNL